MKKVKWIPFLFAVATVLLAAKQFLLPCSVESAVGYSLRASQCGIMVVLDEISEGEGFDLDTIQMTEVSEMLSSLSLRRTLERGDVIYHKEGFGWYSIAFSDEEGQVFHPTMQVDSNGDVFIDCVKYKIVDEAKKIELMNLLGTICGR